MIRRSWLRFFRDSSLPGRLPKNALGDGIGNKGDEDEVFLSRVQETMGAAISAEGHVACFDGEFFVFVRILAAALNQIIRFIVADMLMNRNGTARLQRNLGKHLDPLAEGLWIHDGITDDASRLGVFRNELMPRHRTWVLSRLAIEMNEMPKSYDKFFVETWVENAMKYFTARDFKICGKVQASESSSDADGDSSEEKVYGYGKSVWAMIDTETRQPVDIFSINDGLIREYIETEKECPIAASSRVI